MKAFKITSRVMLIIAAVLLVASLIISTTGTTDNTIEAGFLTLAQLNILVLAGAGVGVFLMTAKNEVAKKVGNGLTVSAFVIGLFCAVNAMVASGEMAEKVDNPDISMGAIVMIIAVVFFVLHYAFAIAAYVMSKNGSLENPDEDIRIKRVKEWKKLLDEDIITKEEFEVKRVQILDINPKEDK